MYIQSMARKLGELLCFPYFTCVGMDYRAYLSKVSDCVMGLGVMLETPGRFIHDTHRMRYG